MIRVLTLFCFWTGRYFLPTRRASISSSSLSSGLNRAPERPHGLSYSLTLHSENGERLVGFDNAHPMSSQRGPAGRRRVERDHRHRLKTTRPYQYRDAATLMADFWEQVGAVLKERGVE